MKQLYLLFAFVLITQMLFSQSVDTLRNFAANTELVALKYSGRNQWGYYLGQNHVSNQQYAEKYYIHGKGEILGLVTHLTGTFVHPNNTVEFNVYSVAKDKLPGIRLHSIAVKYKDLDLSGKAYAVKFQKPIAVSDSFFVAFNVHDYMHGGFDGDTIGLYSGIKNSRTTSDLKNFGRNAVQVHNHDMEEWKDFYSQNFTPIATHFALFPIVEFPINGLSEYDNKDFKILEISPNPAKNSVIINYECNTGGEVVISIYNLQGKQVKKEIISEKTFDSQSYKLNLEGLPSGTYVLNLRTQTTSLTSKIIIE